MSKDTAPRFLPVTLMGLTAAGLSALWLKYRSGEGELEERTRRRLAKLPVSEILVKARGA
ncbi:hypothetical protein [Altericroceibacterium xinjiangense]|uniref:hypothetical protein n=1 Tax=Altericroceibacterium xinjiangense TaxID=762261 RepID=UPI000F7DC137|nr:hypothetical protein [Altericroceibacterium xinjiangense]